MSAQLSWSSASAIMPGETESGDLHLACARPDGMLFAAVDGLGHGADAAVAARLAIATLEQHAYEPVVALVTQCHEALLNTRGVALSLAVIDTEHATLSWLGVGNVDGLLLRADAARPLEKLLLRSGVVGYQLPMLQAATLNLELGDLLVFTTDGLSHDCVRHLDRHADLQTVAERMLVNSTKGTDDALVLMVRYGETTV